MPRVDFYVLGEVGTQAQHRYACKLAEQAFAAGTRMYLRTSSPAESVALDELLWTYSDRAFLPHEIAGSAEPSHARVAAVIGTDNAPAGYRALLINTAADMPPDAAEFEQIAEVVDADPGRKQLARERFRQYRERGWTLESHNVT
ncbi:MAG: DNA polymerase III subunit chi [Steroidobacteraceae bacterium]